MDPITAASFIAGGASLGAGALSAIQGANLNKKNRKWQEKMVNQQREYDERIYSERYSPSAQVQNMRSAGLNPVGETQTMNVGTSTSTPTPATQPLDFSAIGDAGQAIASGFHARRAYILEQDKFYHQQLIDWREQFRKELDSAKTREDYDSIIKQREESIEKSKVDRRFQSMLNDELDEARKQGYNRFKNEMEASADAHELSLKQKELADLKKQYTDAQIKDLPRQQRDAHLESLARARQSLASAYEANVSAQLKSVQAKNLELQEKREQELHVIRKAAEEYARDLGATQSQIAELTLAMEQRWSSDVPVWGQVLDFIHNNLNLGGSVSKTFK